MNSVRGALATIAMVWSSVQAAGGREDVLRTFREYETLNADFLLAASSGTGKYGKPYAQLRREAEAYAEGPFEAALRRAQQLLCSSQDKELLSALLRVVVATSNSASEAPTEVLLHVAKCQPSQFRALASQLPERNRANLANRAPELKSLLGHVAQ